MTKALFAIGFPLCSVLALTCEAGVEGPQVPILLVYLALVGASAYHDHLEAIRARSRRWYPEDEI